MDQPAEQAATTQVTTAQRQQLERLRYQAAFAARQFSRVDPDNRLVAAELEQRWEGALRALKEAEAQAQRPAAAAATLVPLPEALRTALTDLGQQLPALWQTGQLTRAQQKAYLRCLIDKVVIHRSARDRVQARIVWHGGATTTQELPIPVGALADLREGAELEQRVLALTAAGESDDAIATTLTREGYRSPMRTVVLPSTVRTIRLRHGQVRSRSQSHPRHIAGALTVPQLARLVGVTPHWLYDRIYTRSLPATQDPTTGLYLFPDAPATLDRVRALILPTDDHVGSGTE